MKKVLLSVAAMLMIFGVLFAENDGSAGEEAVRLVSLSGQVTDSNSGEALVGVKVVVEETKDIVYTDFDGSFSFENLIPGSYQLTAAFISYEKSDIQVNLNQQESVEVSLEQVSK